jgi:hypothetical protein
MNDHPKQQASSAPSASVASNNTNSPPSAYGMSGASDLQQALFQSMAASQGSGHGHSNSFGTQVSNQGQGHHQGLSMSQMDLVQQLMGMGDNKNTASSGGAAAVGAPFAQQTSQPQAQNNGGNNSNIVSQLVATLQAQQVQQQSQQQAQVQAAISRAFGPSSVGGGQQQMQMQPNNSQNNLLSQMQLAHAQGLLSGNNNFLPSLGGMGGNDVQNRMLQIKRAAMMAGQGQDAMKKPKIDNCESLVLLLYLTHLVHNYFNSVFNCLLLFAAASFQMNKFGSGNLFNSVPGLSNSLFPNSVSLPGMMNQNSAASAFEPGFDVQQKLAGARGAVIVPCRARGMPVDHNFKTAYFVIPDGIEHGDELVCSFPACRQAGVKFRYCVDCKVPVAKRNFRNRHRHGVPGGEGGSASGEDDEDYSGEEEEDDNKPEGQDPTNSSMCMPAAESAPEREHLIVIPDGKPMMKKKKKSVRVPCRARGMPMAHNFKTAHFIIPPNIQHGDELVCSFQPCRAAGAKFRYCLHCKVPVAKRNFRNRHKHGNMGEKKKMPPTHETKDTSKEEKGVKSAEDTTFEGKNEERRSSEEVTEDSAESEGDLKPSASPTKTPDISETTSAPNQTTVAISSNHDPSQVQQWVSLLDTKPDPSDKQAMAIWMMNLMHATDAMNSRPSQVSGSSNDNETKSEKDDKPSSPKNEDVAAKEADV